MGERYAEVYQINYLRCIMCGLCVEACPTRALTLTSNFEMSFETREDAIFEKDQLLEPPPPSAPRPARSRAGDMDLVVFWVLAPVSVAAAVLMLFQRNAVHSALLLILNFFTLAVFFLLLEAPFLFVVQIIVYAGAIMVLFLFVIMLLGVERRGVPRRAAEGPARARHHRSASGLALEVFFAVRLGVGLSRGAVPDFAAVNEGGNVQALAKVLFTGYVLPFEVTSILLIIAAIAAMVLARRRGRPAPDATPLEATEPEPAA